MHALETIGAVLGFRRPFRSTSSLVLHCPTSPMLVSAALMPELKLCYLHEAMSLPPEKRQPGYSSHAACSTLPVWRNQDTDVSHVQHNGSAKALMCDAHSTTAVPSWSAASLIGSQLAAHSGEGCHSQACVQRPTLPPTGQWVSTEQALEVP